jgi:coenzyme F420-reducing hydrogenase delta subunit
MKKPGKDIVIFYCTHQGERVTRILKGLNGPEKVRIRKVALPCSGKLEVFQLTRAMESGADGVALFGCREEECRYVVGSSRAKGRISYAAKILDMVGMDEKRVRRFVLESQTQPETLEAIASWLETVNDLEPVPKDPKSP